MNLFRKITSSLLLVGIFSIILAPSVLAQSVLDDIKSKLESEGIAVIDYSTPEGQWGSLPNDWIDYLYGEGYSNLKSVADELETNKNFSSLTTLRRELAIVESEKTTLTIQDDIDIKTNPFQFIFVGRLVFYKNLEVAFKALAIAKKIEPKIKLIIVGDGPHKKKLEELSKKIGVDSNIEFRGYVGAVEKERLIASSSALVFPSLYEGFGIVILEAFAQKKPVLVSDVNPLSDIVTHKKTGYVINPHDENLWANYLLETIKNPNEATTMGMNGHDILLEKYDQNSLYDKIIEMYKKVLESSSKNS